MATETPKEKALKEALAKLEKDFGKGTVVRMSDSPQEDVEVISTGSLGLDAALGIGGLPRGRIVEIYGPESSGKTTLCQHVIAEAQKIGGRCAFIDAEHALDFEYAQKVGVNPETLYLCQPDYGEQGLEVAKRLAETGAFDVIVVDSVAALTPKAELEGEVGDASVGKQARMMGQAMRMLTAAISRSNTLLIFTNQLREKIGVMFGSPETTPGGRALAFFASVRLDIRRLAQVKDGDESVGNRVKVKVVKNKVAAPFRIAEFDIVYGEGINRIKEVVEAAVEAGVIKKSGSWYSHGNDKLGQGEAGVLQLMRDNPDFYQQIAADLHAALHGTAETPLITPQAEANAAIPS